MNWPEPKRTRRRPRLVAATQNAAKVRELERAVAGLAEVAAAPNDISHEARAHRVEAGGEQDESGPTLAAIACRKATRCSASLPDELVVATDGGLLVPALGDAWDPRRTRRFAGDEADDRARADALLALTRDLVGAERQIAWREAMAVARNGRIVGLWEAEGEPGRLAADVDPALVQGGRGFWIPALWVCPEFDGRRLAELTEAELATRDDHWARLGVQLRHFLTEVTSSQRHSGELDWEAAPGC